MSKQFVGIQKERDGSVVRELDFHHGLELASLDRHAEGAEADDERFIKGLGLAGRRGAVVAGAPALPAIAVERELRDAKHAAAFLAVGASKPVFQPTWRLYLSTWNLTSIT